MSKQVLFTPGVVEGEGAMVRGRERRMDLPNPCPKNSQVDKLSELLYACAFLWYPNW